LIDFDEFESAWKELWQLRHQNIFTFPGILKVWWREFGGNYELNLLEVKENSALIGIAPLIRRDDKAYFIGSTNVFDYLDFIIAPGKENYFFNELIDFFKKTRIKCLDLKSVRHDSSVITNLIELARKQMLDVSYNEEDSLLEMNLASNWDDYLNGLPSRYRHELRRKLRRFEEAGKTNFEIFDNIEKISESTDLFFEQFRACRIDKATFMTPGMERFFRSFIKAMSEAQLLKLGILELNESNLAMIICLDDGETLYLYNNCFDPQYRKLNLGFVSKALTIKYSIEKGRKMFNFLKGTERYKYHLGGKESKLYNCQILF
jgi:CelD/BcsL family acetyltransferase involved in cellulose biosynthesis